VTCNIGTIVAGGTATVVINTRAGVLGTVTNTASVQGNEPDVEPLNNSARCTTLIRTAGVPDLIATLLEGPPIGSTGGSIMITNEVRNVGYSNAVLTFRVTFYLSPDEIITTNDIHIGSRSVFGLGTNESSWGVAVGNIPVDVDPGVYYFGALVDFSDEIEELDERNNQLIAGTMQIILGPELTMTSCVGPAVGGIGGTIRVESRVDNVGTGNPGSFAVGYYLSTDSTITVNDLRIGSQMVNTLPPTQYATGAITATISSSLTPGFYYLGAIADFSGAIDEPDESNNAILGNIIEIKLGVDLAMQSVSGPTNASTGQMISITNVMANIGSNNASAFSLGWYLSPDLAVTTNDQRIGTRNIGFLAAGASVTNILTVAIPLTNRAGLYYLGCIADYPNAIPEASETNNAMRGNSIQIGVGPDIAMTRLTGPSRGSPGSYMLLTNVVSNLGSAPPGAFSVGFYLSADPDITTSDTRIGTRSVATLLPGTNSTSVVTVTLSATLPKGTFYLGAIADFLNQIPEITETNNTILMAVSPIEILNGFDLAIADVRGPTNSCTGATLNLTNIAQNIGIDNVGTFTVGLYLSDDPNITTNDTRIGTRSVTGGLPPNGRNTNGTSVTIPVTIVPGQYWFGAVADYNNQLPEANETNNATLGNPVSIAIGPDLSATFVSGPALAGQSTRVQVTTAVRNLGCGNPGTFAIGIYLSTDPIINGADTLVGVRYVAGLAPGTGSTGATTVTIAGDLTSGPYYWGMIADFENDVPEITETNNARVGNAVTVTPLIDLVMTQMSGPDEWCTGNPFEVTNTVQNIGSAGALAFTVGLYLSPDPIITKDDMLMYTRNLTGLGVGQTSPNVMTLINIGGLNSGTYYYGAIADTGEAVTESNEENNAVLGNAVVVTLGPDLVLKDIIAPQYGSQGSSIPVTSIIANEGCGNAPIGFGNGIYLSPDPLITTADTRLGSRTINTLASGTINTGTTVVALSAALASGTYYLGVIADYGNAIYEVTDTNNVLLGTPIVIRPASDLVVGQIGGPTNACTGKSIIISNVVDEHRD
jgi:subtilase family serine protease